MPKYTVWTNVTERKMINAAGPTEAASEYHREIGAMPDNWDGTLHVRDEEGEERSFRRKAA